MIFATYFFRSYPIMSFPSLNFFLIFAISLFTRFSSSSLFVPRNRMSVTYTLDRILTVANFCDEHIQTTHSILMHSRCHCSWLLNANPIIGTPAPHRRVWQFNGFTQLHDSTRTSAILRISTYTILRFDFILQNFLSFCNSIRRLFNYSTWVREEEVLNDAYLKIHRRSHLLKRQRQNQNARILPHKRRQRTVLLVASKAIRIRRSWKVRIRT